MPAAGPQNTYKRQQVKRVKPKKRVYHPGPTNTAQSYVSQGKAVEKVANQKNRQAEVVRAKARQVVAPKNIIKANQRTQRQAIQGLSDLRQSNPKKYDQNLKDYFAGKKEPGVQKTLKALSHQDPATVVGKKVTSEVGRQVHKLSTRSADPHSLAAITTPQLTATANSKAAKYAGKTIESAAREAIDIPANIVPSTYHIAKPIVQNPGSPKAYVKAGERGVQAVTALPKEYIKAIEKKGLKGAGDVFQKRPLSTALTVAPLPRLPGLAAGRVARTIGKMPKVEAKVIPETAFKENVPRSKSYFKARRQATKSRKPTPGKIANQVTEHKPIPKSMGAGFLKSPVERRVDEQVSVMEHLSRKAQADTYRKAYKVEKKKPNVTKAQAQETAAQLALKTKADVRTQAKNAITEGMALRGKPKYTAKPKVTPRDTKSTQFSPNSKPYRRFNPVYNKNETKFTSGRGALDKNGKLHTWFEDEGTHVQKGFGQHKSDDLNITPDGTVHITNIHHGSLDHEYEVAAKIIAQDSRLKPVPWIASKPEYKAALAKEKAKLSIGTSLRQTSPGGDIRTFKTEREAELAAGRYNNNPKYNVEMAPIPHEGGFAVIPKSAVDRLEGHSANTKLGPIGAGVKAYNTLWRKSVLATHPTWYAGNVIEAALRSLTERVGPRDYYRGYKTIGKTTGNAKEALKGHTVGGGHLDMQLHLPEETQYTITGSNGLADIARGLQRAKEKPGLKQTAYVWDKGTSIAMGSLSGRVESFFQTGMLGKALKEHPLMDNHIRKTSNAAMEDAAKGLHETANQVELGRAIDRMYGAYGKFSPGMRKMIANYTPFIAWTLNSLNWLYHYLPKDHPVLTATAASAQPYVDQWLKDQGLSAFVHGALPPFLQGSIPVKGGRARFPTRYTPFAIAAGAPGTIGSALLPQFLGADNILTQGINWKGQKLKNPDGTPLDPAQLSIMAALTFAEGMVPASQQFIGPADNYGGGARGLNIVKPKSGSDIGRAFNPLAKVKTPTDSKSKKSKSLLGGSTSTKQKSLLGTSTSKKQKSLLDGP